jgi:predicted RNase H-like HicB family nuclease
MIYPLFIFKADDGTFDGYFPDIEGCMFAGNNLESALRDAESLSAAYGSFDRTRRSCACAK